MTHMEFQVLLLETVAPDTCLMRSSNLILVRDCTLQHTKWRCSGLRRPATTRSPHADDQKSGWAYQDSTAVINPPDGDMKACLNSLNGLHTEHLDFTPGHGRHSHIAIDHLVTHRLS
ncbi:hypothetical protein [Nitrosomonas mobilis]|uniref:hypothetical protein n=1 Tax=Nitrosomonas mobilis TaxID=51642 RepID=UPI000B7D1C99|nr:hypothetical protein [Nitrosomonas mobilis]HNO75650.1 hypothetical protein [Nitrosomonas mobilis]